MGEVMMFPDTVEQFMEQYKITDTEQIYTNGADLVPIFRMKQWFEHLPPAEELSKERTGVWITPRKNYCKCSVCGMGYHHPVGEQFDNYCAECGAKMKGNIEMRKIDACPYCGCEEAYVESYEHHVGAIRYRVCCPKCGVFLDSGYWQTADRAIEEWNNRSSLMWWLPVSEQHPFNEYGEGKPVITVDTLGVMRIAEYVGGVWQTPDGEPIANTKKFPVTHWMPLPKPPKGE